MKNPVKIHGTYPLDTGDWVHEAYLPIEEVIDLLNLPWEPFKHNPYGAGYLWLNKGYVVLGMPPEQGLTSAEAGFLEVGRDLEHEGVPMGAYAVYLHDGTYSLIQKVRDRRELARGKAIH